MKQLRRIAILAMCASATIVGLAGAPAHAAPPAPQVAASTNASGTPGVTADAWAAGRAAHGASVTAAQAVEAYWTPARMRSATPVEDSAAYKAAVSTYAQRQMAAQRKAMTSPGGIRPAPATPHSVAPQTGGAGVPDFVPDAINPGYAYWQPTARTSGKVFFSFNGAPYVCSGTIVNSEGQNSVWTAGHCVFDSGVWMANWQFVPAYDDDLADPRPYGTWTAFQLWTRTAWMNDQDFAEDMGVALMNMNFGFHIVAYLGGQGITTGNGDSVFANAFGYPAEAPFDGGNLYQCRGTSSPEWRFLFFWSETIQIGCDMTRGSSGGGWLWGWDGNWGWLNGVNSRIDRIVNPTIMLSPYFDDTAWSLFSATRGL
jgi:hypothetical protein